MNLGQERKNQKEKNAEYVMEKAQQQTITTPAVIVVAKDILNKMPDTLIKDNPDVPTCPACGSQNTFKDSGGWVYCNECGEVWEEGEEL